VQTRTWTVMWSHLAAAVDTEASLDGIYLGDLAALGALKGTGLKRDEAIIIL